MVGWVVNALLWMVFPGGPIVSALLITRRGSDGFHETYGEDYTKLLAFWSDLQAYLLLGTDQLPVGVPTERRNTAASRVTAPRWGPPYYALS